MPTKPLLYLPVKNPFTMRDYERMGIKALERNFEVRILDCTAWLMPTAFRKRGRSDLKFPNLHSIGSLKELKLVLANVSSGGFAIDYVGQFSVRTALLFHFLKAKDIRLVVMDSGAVPPPRVETARKSYLKKLVFAIKGKAVRRHANALLVRIVLRCLPDQTPDYALVSGTSWKAHPRYSSARVTIPAHSFDYETFLQVRSLPEKRDYDYAVYLDENIAGHEDNVELGLGDPVTESRFFDLLSKYFDKIEAATGMPVLIAGYPSEHAGRARQFRGREFVVGETAQLIRNAKLVFAHGSTAVSFAVLWRRPLVFLTSDEMTSSWYYPTIEVRSRILNCPVFNINAREQEISVPGWKNVDETAYRNYQDTYIKSVTSRETSLWEIFLGIRDERPPNACDPIPAQIRT